MFDFLIRDCLDHVWYYIDYFECDDLIFDFWFFF